MKMYINMTHKEFAARFENDVTYYKINPTIYRGLSLKEELAGGINNKFWIQKTQPSHWRGRFFRQFIGKIKETELGILLLGKFTHITGFGLLRWLLCLQYVLATIFLLYIMLSPHTPTSAVVILCCICFSYHLVIKGLSRKEDRAVIAYLESLRDSY